ncbi:NAD(P)-dependent oxidoreductase [Actinomadura sp. BRA 177]|uniref:NAD(P)-dependent oxidoreductase n=1 Tax=Actinomadura sp. BRA 177 TaxID=2745202 RepID=UPI0015957878|nr:NAD(P)-dependent oxidoreductase [Actinomadura sp. BRA 177]NVI92337.1 NAD(P)-dependent oxidoreductase [Actinomadura sp. BRA 177]
MRILLIGATGMVGSRIAAEARRRGHEVTGVTRSGGEGTAKAEASDSAAIAELAAGHDAAVLSVPPPRDGSETLGPLLATTRGVLDGLRRAGVRRLIVVGGAGSLEVAPGVRLVDTPEFPEIYKSESLAATEQLAVIRAEAGDLDWTYISPAAVIQPGERTGTFRLGGDQLLADAEGNSNISAEDYAIALVDELEKNNAVQRRITAAY